ncbi:hypothetical protein DB29_03751 [Shouchella clausii]|nr:hypothetical protein DB29_03751 [Shouchella clausii]
MKEAAVTLNDMTSTCSLHTYDERCKRFLTAEGMPRGDGMPSFYIE